VKIAVAEFKNQNHSQKEHFHLIGQIQQFFYPFQAITTKKKEEQLCYLLIF